MKNDLTRLIQQLVEQERTRLQAGALTEAPIESAGIPFSELAHDVSNEPLAMEWNVYRREVGRLLAEGQEGRFVLIKGEKIVGLFDDWTTGRQAGLKQFGREPFFVHAIRATVPHLNIRGINRPWPA